MSKNIILIIGASSDIGLDLIRNIDEECLILAHYNKSNKKLLKLTKSHKKNIVTIKADLSKEIQIIEMLNKIEENYGTPNKIVHLAAPKFENIRFIPVIAAIWFLIFSYPMINYFKHHIEYKENSDQTPVFKKLIAIIWKNKFTSTGKFLLARMIYSDALIVLIAGGGVYASGVFGFTPGELLKLAVFANLVAFVGVLLGGYLNDKISSKTIILTCIFALTVCVFYSSIIAQTKTQFFINVMVISLFIGSIQSASRVMMTGLLKADDQGSGFGLFSFSGRITAFAGPLLAGTMTFFYSQRIGLLSISIFFILGFILMLFVDKDQENKKIP